MDIHKLIARVQHLLAAPKSEWPVISTEPATTVDLYKGYIAILAAIPAIVSFLQVSVIGVRVPFMGTMRVGVGTGIVQMLVQYVLSLVLVYVMAMIIDALAPTFGGQRNRVQALKTVAYAYTAVWIAYLGILIPAIGWLIVIVGVAYSIYLLYLGLPHTMQSPRERATGYTVATLAIGIALSFIVSLVVGGIGGSRMTNSVAGNDLHFEEGSVGNQLERWAQGMETAAKNMEAAAKSGESQAQAEALQGLMGAALSGSGGPVESLPPEQLKKFVPEKIGKWQRRSFNVERSSAMGIQVSEANASYESDGRIIDLEITDMGSAKGLAAFVGWMGVNSESESSDGYERSYRDGKRLVHEKWSRGGRGEYTVIVGDRFSVEASSQTDNIDELKAFVRGLNLGELEDLRTAGVR